MGLVDLLSTLVLAALVGGGTAWALVKFLVQRLVDHRLSKDLEKFKTALSEKTDVLKTQLAIFAHEQNVAASRVDTQRADAISNIYASIRNIINPTSSIISGCPIVNGTAEQLVEYYFSNAQAAHTSCGVLANKLADLAIYFNNDTYLKIANFAKASMDATGTYRDSLSPLIADRGSALDVLNTAECGRALLREQFANVMNPQAKQLTGVFRKQLGIEIEIT